MPTVRELLGGTAPSGTGASSGVVDKLIALRDDDKAKWGTSEDHYEMITAAGDGDAVKTLKGFNPDLWRYLSQNPTLATKLTADDINKISDASTGIKDDRGSTFERMSKTLAPAALQYLLDNPVQAANFLSATRDKGSPTGLYAPFMKGESKGNWYSVPADKEYLNVGLTKDGKFVMGQAPTQPGSTFFDKNAGTLAAIAATVMTSGAGSGLTASLGQAGAAAATGATIAGMQTDFDPKAMAKAGLTSYAGGQVGQYVSGLDSVKNLGQTASKAIGGAAGGATSAALSGGDIVTGALAGGAAGAVSSQFDNSTVGALAGGVTGAVVANGLLSSSNSNPVANSTSTPKGKTVRDLLQATSQPKTVRQLLGG